METDGNRKNNGSSNCDNNNQSEADNNHTDEQVPQNRSSNREEHPSASRNNNRNNGHHQHSADNEISQNKVAASTASISSENGTAHERRPLRQSSRSIKAPKPFSPNLISSSVTKANASDNFICGLYDMIDEFDKSAPSLMRWSTDGAAFVVNPDHPELESVLEHYLGRTYFSNA
jgi:hypothetical protein